MVGHLVLPKGKFSITVLSGLVRLGLCTDRADVDNLGTDLLSFGYGGTGKMLGSKTSKKNQLGWVLEIF